MNKDSIYNASNDEVNSQKYNQYNPQSKVQSKNKVKDFISIKLIVYFTAIIAILYYPFNLYFSGKWEAKSNIQIHKFESLAGDNTWNQIYEFITQLGLDNLNLRFYSLTLFIGLVHGFFLMIYYFKKEFFSDRQIESLFINLVLIGIIGSRLGYVLVNYEYFKSKPLDILALYLGGFTLLGGLILCALYILYYAFSKKINVLKISDALVPSTLMIMIWGRFGNFFNYESYGPKTDVAWKMFVPEGAVSNNRYKVSEGLNFYHPAFLYEIILNILLIVILTYIYPFIKKPGLITSLFLISYGIGRFIIEKYRLDVDYVKESLTYGQAAGAILVFTGLILLIYYVYSSKRRNT